MKEQKIVSGTACSTGDLYQLRHPLLFQHENLLEDIDQTKSIEQQKLVNKLNHLNFCGGHVFTIFRHEKSGENILLAAIPQPCIKDEALFHLDLPDDSLDLSEHSLSYLLIEDGLNAILTKVSDSSLNGRMLRISLPQQSHVIKKRISKRYPCRGITCRATQENGHTVTVTGELLDFTPRAFAARFNDNNGISFAENKAVVINIEDNGSRLFSGLCNCIRNGLASSGDRVVFAPVNSHVPLYPKRELRNPRQNTTPSFSASFQHPLFKTNIQRDISEISTSGFSLLDNAEEEVLLPGMSIPKMSIVFAGILKMNCSAQVVYRQENMENNTVHCGVAITDMDLPSYSYLNHILGVYLDHNAHVSTEVDMDALWEFFFDTGFIYGEKYKHLEPYQKKFKETYRKIYQDNTDIARHFVYEKNGKIYGHIAMVHAYNPSWVIHHFAARRLGGRLPGSMVLRQIIHYISSYSRLPSAGMDYVMTYYRPENRIIDRIFGGFTRKLNNSGGSSLDIFSYLTFKKNDTCRELSAPWSIREALPSDFLKLNAFYKNNSGGLLLEALSLESDFKSLIASFSAAGFKRDCRNFCLCHRGTPTAFFIVNRSDLGLNLSDLLNGIKIILLDKIPWDILSEAINNIAVIYPEASIPVLIHPAEYLASQNVVEEKQYALWILNTRNSAEQYLSYMNRLMKLKVGN